MNKHGQWVIGVPGSSGGGWSGMLITLLVLMVLAAIALLIAFVLWRKAKARRQAASEQRARAQNEAIWRESMQRSGRTSGDSDSLPAE